MRGLDARVLLATCCVIGIAIALVAAASLTKSDYGRIVLLLVLLCYFCAILLCACVAVACARDRRRTVAPDLETEATTQAEVSNDEEESADNESPVATSHQSSSERRDFHDRSSTLAGLESSAPIRRTPLPPISL
jgi:hypothetical protein